MNITLKKFDIRNIKNDNVLIIGKRHCGKSFLAKDILFHHRNVLNGIVFDPTLNCSQFYTKFTDDVYEEYSSELVSNVFNESKKQSNDTDRLNGYIVYDNCICSQKEMNDITLRNAFMNGRCAKLLNIMALSYGLTMPPCLRANCDYIFIFRESFYSNRKRLYDMFAGMFNTFEQFCDVMDDYTKNNNCLVIDNKSKNWDNIEDCVFWYNAEVHEPFTMGDQIITEIAEEFTEKVIESAIEEVVNEKVVEEVNEIDEAAIELKQFEEDQKEEVKKEVHWIWKWFGY